MARGRTAALPAGRVQVLACAVAFVEALLFTALAPILPTFVERFDVSTAGAGVLAAAYPLGAFVAAVPSILIARVAGLRRTVVLSLLVLATASAAFALAESAAVVFVARFLQGVGSALSLTGALAWLTMTVVPSRRAEAIGVAFSAAFVGALLGPLLGALTVTVGLAAVFLGFAAAVAVLTLLTIRLQQPPHGRTGELPLWRLVHARSVVLGVGLIGMAGVLLGVFGVLIPFRLDALGWSAAAIGAVFAVASVVTAGTAPGVGRIADRRGRLAPLRMGFALAAVVSIALAVDGGAALYAAIAVVGVVSVGILWAPAMALLADSVERRGYDHASAFGLTNIAWAPGFAVGAAGGAALAERVGDPRTLVLVSALCLATVIGLRSSSLDPGSSAR